MIMEDSKYLEWLESASQEDKNLLERIYELEDHFSDMLFEEDSCVGELLKCQVKMDGSRWEDDRVMLPDELKYFSLNYFKIKVDDLTGCGGYFDSKEQILCISRENVENDNVILHEMIHLHEFVLNEQLLFYHDTLLWALYSDLRTKIENLDKLISSHAHILGEQNIYHMGGLHDILFLLKSLELDIRMGYRLGTVFGYDMEGLAKDLRYDSKV